MSQHILNKLRHFVLAAALKVLPLCKTSLLGPEPVKSPIDTVKDTWLFDVSRPLAEYKSEHSRSMTRLSGSLGRLHHIVSAISERAPLGNEAMYEPAFGVLWSDSQLFDGEPAASSADYALATGPYEDVLFEETVIGNNNSSSIDTDILATS